MEACCPSFYVNVSETLTWKHLNMEKEQRKPNRQQQQSILYITHHNAPYLINMYAFRKHGGEQTQPQRRYDGSQQYVGLRNSYRLLQLDRITVVEEEKQPVSSASSSPS